MNYTYRFFYYPMLFSLLAGGCSFAPQTIDIKDPVSFLSLEKKIRNESVEIKLNDSKTIEAIVISVTNDSLVVQSSNILYEEVEVEIADIKEISFPQNLHLQDAIEIKTNSGETLLGKILADKNSSFAFRKILFEKNNIAIDDIESISSTNLWTGASRGILVGVLATPFTQLLFNFKEGGHTLMRDTMSNYIFGTLTGVIVGGIIGAILGSEEIYYLK